MKNIVIYIASFALAVSSAAVAVAQDTFMFSNLMTDYARINIQNHALYGPPYSQSETVTEKSAVKAPANSISANPATLRFTPNLAFRKRNLAGFVATADKENPGSGAGLQALFDSGDVITTMGGVIAPLGLRTDDVGDAFAFYVISNWMAVKGRLTTPAKAQVLSIKGQVSRTLLDGGTFSSATGAQKQQTAEALLVQSLLVSGAMQGAQGNAEATAAIGARAAQNVRGIGLDLAALELRPDGFGPAK